MAADAAADASPFPIDNLALAQAQNAQAVLDVLRQQSVAAEPRFPNDYVPSDDDEPAVVYGVAVGSPPSARTRGRGRGGRGAGSTSSA